MALRFIAMSISMYWLVVVMLTCPSQGAELGRPTAMQAGLQPSSGSWPLVRLDERWEL